MTPRQVFVREATGLVREISPFDASVINWSGETIIISLIVFFSYTYLFPNANLLLAMIITIVAFVPLSLAYAMSVVATPRSGGDYVFVSRTMHPSLGFMLALTLIVWFSFYSGAFANWIFTLGIAPTLSVVGNIEKNAGIVALTSSFTDNTVVLIGGASVIIVTAIVALLSTKWALRLQTILIGIGLLSTVAIAAVLLASTNQQFQAAFNSYSSSFSGSSDYYDAVLSNAAKAGLTARSGGFSWSDTIAMVPFASYIYLYISEMQAVGGEMKTARTSAYSACLMTILVGGLIGIAVVIGWNNTVTQSFANAVGYDYYNGAGYALPVAPTYNFLASLLAQNEFVLWLLNIGFLTTSIASMFQFYIFTSRYFLASAFDRILPEKLAAVSDKYHTPHVAVIVSMALALITLPIYTYYASILATLSTVLAELIFAYLVFAIATVIFPFTRRTKSIYQNSPINKSIGGIPIITILGIFNVAFLCYIGYVMLVNSTYGVNSAASLVSMVLVAAAAPIWYFARKSYLKTRGIDLGMVFTAIPPE